LTFSQKIYNILSKLEKITKIMSERYEKNPNELGAIWKKESPKGTYYSGSITVNGELINIVMFKTDKKSPNAPDWRILRSIKQDGAAAPAPKPVTAKAPVAPAAPKPRPASAPQRPPAPKPQPVRAPVQPPVETGEAVEEVYENTDGQQVL
jgi:uncharacterized protein (DUF736 family)